MYRFKKTISNEKELRSLVGDPSDLVVNKVISFLDDSCMDFISKSPFLVLTTSGEKGQPDASPRGDHPGFVHILNEKQLVIPERPGNKRIDSLRNIIANPRAGLLFFIPGLGETLRIKGRAEVMQDKDVLKRMAVKGRPPELGIAVEVEECFIHCAKAFIRSKLWQPETWIGERERPSAARMLFTHASLPNSTVDSIQDRLDESYRNKLY
ncbi:pyridoxamine 5'-phosphate oxidase family protein [Halobacillus kuroshimensis]|uniref:Pyridoxamine 5'-phosphate oxidase family protein n=1 Tax=Halobacillus kuroshimensis TaxID=302481 RepID=A0ABS3DRR9_9BACI|nr:pyridoxamine 5'-phosphate oxidase family protein [Halobacillus kuroshimensis]MBN8234032.1 pyridoxamine 5'-phosphate oxidase family protein [Halobacillus kuroshimensis]